MPGTCHLSLGLTFQGDHLCFTLVLNHKFCALNWCVDPLDLFLTCLVLPKGGTVLG